MKVRNKREDMFPGDDLAKSVWESKYSTDDEQHYDQMHERIAKEIIEIDSKYHKSEEEFFENKKYSNLSVYGQERPYLNNEILINYLRDFKYIVPQGSIMHGAGIDKAISLSNCFVIDSAKDSYSGIFLTDQEQAQLMKRRGGVGHDISFLRPKGTVVNNSANSSTGAVSFAHRFSNTTREVAQEGRRGALMLSCFVPETPVLVDSGWEKISDVVSKLKEGKQVKAWTHEGYQNITDYQEFDNRDIYEIETENGKKIEVTPDHEFMVRNINTNKEYLKAIADVDIETEELIFYMD